MYREASYAIRLAEIESGLRRRVCVAENLRTPEKWDHPLPQKTKWQRLFAWLHSKPSATELLRTRPERMIDQSVLGWAEANMQGGDDLWFYEFGADLCGEEGYAILRKGAIVDFFPVMEY